MKKALFETPTLADSVAKAARISPNRGAAMDRSPGIVIDIDPVRLGAEVVISSSNLEVYFRQVVAALEVGDEPARWRIPARLASGVISSLPMTSGSQIKLLDKGDGSLYFAAGKTKAKLRLIPGDYLYVPAFDSRDLGDVTGFSRRLAQVAWAVDSKSTGPLGGVHIDGEHMFACDREKLAMVPCKVPVDRPVTAPLADVSALIKNTSDIKLRAGQNRLEMMPDSYTQASTTLIEEAYPNVKGLMKDLYDRQVVVGVDLLKASLERMMALGKEEKSPATCIEIGLDVMKLEMDVPDIGKIIDEFDVSGGRDEQFRIHFQPTSLLGALNVAATVRVTIDYGPSPLHPVRITDGDGLMVLLMPFNKGGS